MTSKSSQEIFVGQEPTKYRNCGHYGKCFSSPVSASKERSKGDELEASLEEDRGKNI